MPTKSSSKKYPLIPSVQLKITRLSPVALVPAVPVQLGSTTGIQLYAAIDTAAKISTVSNQTLQELEQKGIVISKRQFQGLEGSTEMVNLPLVLCDVTFAPWVDLGDVPFVVQKGGTSSDPVSRILLGFESCLSNLRLDIDYPRQVLAVYALKRIQRRVKEPESPIFPSAISESEMLIAMGSYRSAAAMIGAAIEETFTIWLGETRPARGWSSLLSEANRAFGFAPELKTELKKIWSLRNLAVHGTGGLEVSKREAEEALRAAKKIIARTWDLKIRKSIPTDQSSRPE